jgi:hypothetical protein
MATNVRFNKLVDRYMACWNETDPEARHKLVHDVWAPDATYYNRIFVCQGIEQIEYAIGRSHEEYYSKGFTFLSQNDAYGHHHGAKFGWVMISATTGEVDMWGQDFVLLNDAGQILVDYQFNLKRPTV